MLLVGGERMAGKKIVLCENCKWWQGPISDLQGRRKGHCEYHRIESSPSWFCAVAEEEEIRNEDNRGMRIGDTVYIRGTVDEIRKDVVIIKNDGGYFATVENEVTMSKELHSCLLNKAYDNVLDVISSFRSEHGEKDYRNACDEIAHTINSFFKTEGVKE